MFQTLKEFLYNIESIDLSLEFLSFDIRICFGFRDSNFEFILPSSLQYLLLLFSLYLELK